MGALENKKNSCLVDLTDVILAVEDANPKLVGVFADVDLQESVDNRLVKVDSLAIANLRQQCGKTWDCLVVASFYLVQVVTLSRALNPRVRCAFGNSCDATMNY